jgi:zinc transporter 1/2/3
MFANSCIGHMSYEATAPAIALAAAFITFLLDFLGHRHMAKHHADGAVSPSSSRDGHEKSPRSPGETPGVDPQFLELGHDHHAHLAASDQKWQVLVLEAGILFHSIMIGVTLGASGGNGWTTLLIVIVFHQFFEGLA